ncbi:MAG: DUF2007 domain-containing protein [Anaerolineales bacterium]|jgi:hypothetical protein
MDRNDIVVGTTSGMLEAEILRSLLKSRGIEARLSHEALTTIYGFGVGPLAEVEIIVPADQAEEARQILEDYYANRIDEDDSEDTE